MSVAVEFTYEMSKLLGARHLDIQAATVAEAVDLVRARCIDPEAFDRLARVAALAVNGVLIHHRRGPRTPLRDGDTLSFVKAAAGG